jgi:hypothetical protein
LLTICQALSSTLSTKKKKGRKEEGREEKDRRRKEKRKG